MLYFAFNSLNGINKNYCLSFSIPSPVSIMSTSNILFNTKFEFSSNIRLFKFFCYWSCICWMFFFIFSSFIYFSDNSMKRSPLYLLYFTLFWIMLNIASEKFFQSPVKLDLSLHSKFWKIWTFIYLFFKNGEKGISTLLTYFIGNIVFMNFLMFSPFLIFIL